MLCILYVNLVGMCLGLAALLFERTLPATSPRRWIWCLVIPISVFLPGYYRAHHTWSVADAYEQQAVPPLGQAIENASLSALDPGLWAQIQNYDSSIQRVWLTMSALLFLWGVSNAWRVSRLLTLSRRGRGANGSAVVDGVPVVVTDLMGPATVGFWHSRVLLPRWVLALPEVQQRYVVRHEEEHRRAHDGRLLFVASLLLLLLPWSLALWWQLRRLCLAVEMDCDNRVVNGLGNATAYGELLLRIAEVTSRGPRLQPALLGGVGTLERRLTALLAPTPLRHIQRLLLPAAAVGLLLVVLKMPHPVLGGHSNALVSTTSVATGASHQHSRQVTEVTIPQR